MNKKELLLKRLDEIGMSLMASKNALALLALGSCGLETERMDEYSDLDFFAIVKDGYKKKYIDNLNWLESITPFSYQFKNTVDGYKLLFQDGIFCEFAVFEAWELERLPFSKGRLVWKEEGFDESLCIPEIPESETHEKSNEIDIEWEINEILTNLYIGLGRYKRGEKFSAYAFVQRYAIDRVINIISNMEEADIRLADSFDKGRRIEKRYSELAEYFPAFLQGYDKTPESAKAILNFLEQHFTINEYIKQGIIELF